MTDGEMFGDTVYEGGDAVEDTENLDPVENLTAGDPDEIMQTGYSPPDCEPHNLRDAPTPAEEREGTPLDLRLAQEETEVSEESLAPTDERPRAGRLLAPDYGAPVSRETDLIAEDVGPAGYASSAEEAAMHVIGEDELEG
jgi:hypothetical protein